MRRVLGLLGVIGLVAAISPATVAAARPIQASLTQSGIRCELSTEVGAVAVYVEASPDGGFAGLGIWSPGSDPMEELPDIINDWAVVTFDGSRLVVAADLLRIIESPDPEDEPTYEPAGTATIEVILSPTGEVADFSGPDQRDGNRLVRRGFYTQGLTVDGSLTLDLLDGTGDVVELDGCDGGSWTQTLFVTNPNGYVVDGNQRFMSCQWTTDAGTIELRALNDTFGTTFSELIIVDGDSVLVGLTVPELSAAAYLAHYELFDPATGMVHGSATAGASLTASGERINDREWVDGIRFSLVGKRLVADGELMITIDGVDASFSMDAASCDVTDLRVRVIERIAQG